MTPTVGRIVHFYTFEKTKHFNGQGNGPYAAIITQVTRVGSGSMVSLKVLYWGGDYDAGSVFHQDDADAKGESGRYWVWPPRE